MGEKGIVYFGTDFHANYEVMEAMNSDAEKAKEADPDVFINLLLGGDMSMNVTDRLGQDLIYDLMFDPGEAKRLLEDGYRLEAQRFDEIYRQGPFDFKAGVHGNWDGMPYKETLGDDYFHNQIENVNGVEMAFQGGSPVSPIEHIVARVLGVALDSPFDVKLKNESEEEPVYRTGTPDHLFLENLFKDQRTSTGLRFLITHDTGERMLHSERRVTKTTQMEALDELVENGDFDLQLYGHWHSFNIGIYNGKILFNPGPAGQAGKIGNDGELVNPSFEGYFGKVFYEDNKITRIQVFSVDFETKDRKLIRDYDFMNVDLKSLENGKLITDDKLNRLTNAMIHPMHRVLNNGTTPRQIMNEQRYLMDLPEAKLREFGIEMDPTELRTDLIARMEKLRELESSEIMPYNMPFEQIEYQQRLAAMDPNEKVQLQQNMFSRDVLGQLRQIKDQQGGITPDQISGITNQIENALEQMRQRGMDVTMSSQDILDRAMDEGIIDRKPESMATSGLVLPGQKKPETPFDDIDTDRTKGGLYVPKPKIYRPGE